jgi:hypothetical protein
MHLIDRLKPLWRLGLMALFWGGLMNACAQAGNVPDQFHFSFGTEYVVEKSDRTTTITYQQAWGDAQRSPELGAGPEVKKIQLTEGATQKIWRAIASIDFAPYKQLKSDDFEPTPPDMRHTESLKLVVDGKTIVAWSEGYKFLKPDLRRPLAEIEDTIREAFEESASK